MSTVPSWTAMSIEEKLEVLRQEMRTQCRQAAAMAKCFDELRRRIEEIERRFEELFIG